ASANCLARLSSCAAMSADFSCGQPSATSTDASSLRSISSCDLQWMRVGTSDLSDASVLDCRTNAHLLYRIGRDDFDALDAHPFVRSIRRVRRGRGNLFQHVIAFDQFAESRVLMVKKTRGAMANEELAAG